MSRNRYEQNYRAAIAKYERSAEYERLRALQYEAFAYHAPWPFFVPRAEFDGLGLA